MSVLFLKESEKKKSILLFHYLQICFSFTLLTERKQILKPGTYISGILGYIYCYQCKLSQSTARNKMGPIVWFFSDYYYHDQCIFISDPLRMEHGAPLKKKKRLEQFLSSVDLFTSWGMMAHI